jgi:hypothetical protein
MTTTKDRITLGVGLITMAWSVSAFFWDQPRWAGIVPLTFAAWMFYVVLTNPRATE